jgi:succinate dehydrogenase/fumarate reductase iron-sulfur protein
MFVPKKIGRISSIWIIDSMSDLNVGDPITVTIKKFDPSQDDAPYDKTYTIPYTREMRVLETLDYIVEEIGDSLAFQWFCGAKKCGMCGVLVNGKPQLGCWEPAQREMTIEPLPNFPVVRDLVIDREQYDANLEALTPRIQRTAEYPGFPEKLDSIVMKETAIMSHCIECMVCVSACPAVGENFFGPAPLVQLAKYAYDPRDEGERAEFARDIAGIDHCVSCYQCSTSCPAEIPIFELAIDGMRKKIAQLPDQKPAKLRTKLFGNIHEISRLCSKLPSLINTLNGMGPVRWLLEKVMGIDSRRSLPSFATQTFDKWFLGRSTKQSADNKVLLFHDTFMTYYEPEIGIAATELLEAGGYEVLLADNRQCCGRTFISNGMRDKAEAAAKHNIDILLPHAKQGIPIIVCEPSCYSAIKEHYKDLVPGDDANIVAEHCFMLEEFIASETKADRLNLSFTEDTSKLLLHGHCHQKYFLGTSPALNALGLPMNFNVEEIPTTCCGMAGSNGYECENYDRSLEAAEISLLPAVREADADTQIVAAGVSCRQQIKHGTGRVAQHPAVVLRQALGNK